MGGQALMEHGEVAELEGEVRRDETRAAASALAVMTALLLLAGLVSAVVVNRRSDEVSIATLQEAAARVDAARSLHLRMDVDFGGGGFTMVADMDNETGDGRLVVELPTGRVEATATKSTLTISVPPERQARSGGKPCVTVDATKEAADMPKLPSAADGKALLTYLAGATGKVRDLGTEDLDGLATHKYGVDVDFAEVVSRMPEAERAGAAGLTGLTGLATIPYEVWMDDDDVIRQVRVTLEFGDFHGGSTVRFDPSDKPVTVEIPPPGTCAVAPDAATAFAMVSGG